MAIAPVSEAFRRIGYLEPNEGVMIVQVQPNGAAAAAYLVAGDMILTINGKRVDETTLFATLKEVKRCTRQGITINTFMLGQDYYMERFVNELTKINRGRAFFTSPENIGDYILVDYLTNRRKKIA